MNNFSIAALSVSRWRKVKDEKPEYQQDSFYIVCREGEPWLCDVTHNNNWIDVISDCETEFPMEEDDLWTLMPKPQSYRRYDALRDTYETLVNHKCDCGNEACDKMSRASFDSVARMCLQVEGEEDK